MSDNDSLSRRRFLQATGGAAGAVAIAGCTGDGDGEGDGGDGTDTGTETTETTGDGDGDSMQGGTLNLINATITTFDPVAATDTASGTIIQNVFDALMNYPNGETTPEAQLASGYETSDDFRTYTFSLKDATFHNGDEVTANDFVYSFERLAASPQSRRSYFILDSLGVDHEKSDDSYQPGSLAVEATSDKELEITLAEPFHAALSMLAYTSFAAVPENIISDDASSEDSESDAYQEFSTSNPIGAGPFEFDTWEEGTEAQIVRYDDYHGEVASLGAVHWQVIEEDSAQYEYSMNRNSDLLSIPTGQYDPNKVSVEETDDLGREVGTYGPIRNGDTVNYLGVPTVNTFYFGMHQQNVPKPVRQAFAYVTNQEEFAQQVFKGRYSGGYHLTPPLIYPGGGNAYTQHAEENYPYGYNESQVSEAQRVMEEAGYGENNRLEVQWTQYSSDTWKEMAQILQQRLSSAYIDMKIEEAEFSTLLERGRSGNLEAYTLGWIADWPSPDNFLQLIAPRNTDTSKEGTLGYVDWQQSDTEAKQQAEEAWQTVLDNPEPTDDAQQARNEAYVQMEEANWEDVVFVNAFHRTDERFWYDHVDIPKFGGMGGSRQMYNTTTKEEQ